MSKPNLTLPIESIKKTTSWSNKDNIINSLEQKISFLESTLTSKSDFIESKEKQYIYKINSLQAQIDALASKEKQIKETSTMKCQKYKLKAKQLQVLPF
jgi:uncharacterized coiled-coil protein SlyX